MKRIAIAAVALVSLGACASAPAAKSSEDRILGTWTCKATSEGFSVEGTQTYAAGGKTDGDAKLALNQGGMSIDIVAKTVASWKFLEDGKLQETITGVTVNSASSGGKPVPVAMVQPIVEQMAKNQTVTSTVVFADASFVSTDEDGVVTTCTR